MDGLFLRMGEPTYRLQAGAEPLQKVTAWKNSNPQGLSASWSPSGESFKREVSGLISVAIRAKPPFFAESSR